MTYEVEIEGRSALVHIRQVDGGYAISVDEGSDSVWSARRLGEAEWMVANGGPGRPVGLHLDGERAELQISGHSLRAKVSDPRKSALDALGGAGSGDVVSPMPGVVVRIGVAQGDTVAAGQVLIVVEAMKMENEFKSPCSGVVSEVLVAVGEALETGARLIHVEPDE